MDFESNKGEIAYLKSYLFKNQTSEILISYPLSGVREISSLCFLCLCSF